MRIWIFRAVAVVLVMSLLLGGSITYATEITETEPVSTEAPTEAPVEEATEAPTEVFVEEPTEESEEPQTYTVDPESGMYQVCDALAEGMEFDQMMVYDATNDVMLYTNTREGDKLYPASTTKLFSAYVALQYLEPTEVVTARDELKLVHSGSSVAYIGRGNQLYAQTVVEGMMLPSGNDAAMVLAAAAGRRIAQDEELSGAEAVEVFVREMNRMAKELGFERSHFSNPDGWHTGSHYTCLNDMARIAKLALENKTIARYMRKYEDKVTYLSGQSITWENTNLLLSPEDGYYRSDAVGMKTGYTRQAEYCLMAAIKCSDGRILVIGVFGYGNENQRFVDVNNIAKACKEQLALEAKQAKEKGIG